MQPPDGTLEELNQKYGALRGAKLSSPPSQSKNSDGFEPGCGPLQRLGENLPRGSVGESASEQLPLRRESPPPEAFPMEALGKVLGGAATVMAEIIQAPDAICAQSVLAAAALGVQPHANVYIDGRTYPLSLFMLTVGESGERKSAVDDVALTPHNEHQRNLLDRYRIEESDYKIRCKAWKAAADKAVRKNGDIEDNLREVGQEPVVPLEPYVLVQEPTYPALVNLLRIGQPSVGLFSDEGGRMIGGHAMREENQLQTAAGLSSLWDGKPVPVNRIGTGDAVLYGRRLSVHLMVQPVVARELFSRGLLRGQGLLNRILPAIPASRIGSRSYREVDLRQQPAIICYFDVLTRALGRAPRVAEGSPNELTPPDLVLDDDAKALFIRLHDAVEAESADGGRLEMIRGFASKLPEQAVRIAGVLTLVDDLHATTINADAMGKAIELAQWYAGEALRLQSMGAIQPGIRDAERLLEWLISKFSGIIKAADRRFHLAEVYQRGPNTLRSAAAARRVCKVLVEHGYIIVVEGGATLDGKHRRQVWELLDAPA